MNTVTRLTITGPKCILALGGGGTRGVIFLAFLDRIVALLRERHRWPDLRLADYFDLIGGTSAGAIIAAVLGMTVALTAAIIDWARQYGRYGYRRVTALLRAEGWACNHKRVERIWRREGLRVPARQPKPGNPSAGGCG